MAFGSGSPEWGRKGATVDTYRVLKSSVSHRTGMWRVTPHHHLRRPLLQMPKRPYLFCPSTVVCRDHFSASRRERSQGKPVPCRSTVDTTEVKVPCRATLRFPLWRFLTFEPAAVPALRVTRVDEVLPPSLLVYGSSVWAWLFLSYFHYVGIPAAACVAVLVRILWSCFNTLLHQKWCPTHQG